MNTKPKAKEISSKLAFKEEAFSTWKKPQPIKPTKPTQDHKKHKSSLLTRLWSGIKKFFKPLTNWGTKKKNKNPLPDSVPYEDFNPTIQDIAAHEHTSRLLDVNKHILYGQPKNPKEQPTKKPHHKKATTTDKSKHAPAQNKLQKKKQAHGPTGRNTKITVQKSSSSQHSKDSNKRAIK